MTPLLAYLLTDSNFREMYDQQIKRTTPKTIPSAQLFSLPRVVVTLAVAFSDHSFRTCNYIFQLQDINYEGFLQQLEAMFTPNLNQIFGTSRPRLDQWQLSLDDNTPINKDNFNLVKQLLRADPTRQISVCPNPPQATMASAAVYR